jgi:hypothetical protein
VDEAVEGSDLGKFLVWQFHALSVKPSQEGTVLMIRTCCPSRWLLVWLAAGFCSLAASFTAQAQTITSINPLSVAAGGPAFMLTVNGTGFTNGQIVRVNGSNRATVLAGTQLMATILATDIANPGQDAINVFDPPKGTSSNTAFLTVLAPVRINPPTLTSAGPAVASLGAFGVRLTLMGTNFRPGARVLISPPLAKVAQSSASIQANDVSVDSVTVLNSNLIVATVSVSPTGIVGLRAIDVVNADGTTTGTAPGSGTSKPLSIVSGNSLGAPLSVTTIAITSPRNGTLVMQGDELYGEAALAGTGSGTVTGAWLWDGNVVEQFATVFSGGQSITLRSRQSFPTPYLGVHAVELRIQQPNNLVTRPVTVVVNPGVWKTEKLLLPPYGGRATETPLFLWAAVPGAAKYQVGFSTRPYFATVKTWYDVTNNQWNIPSDVWESLPEGEIYWTVRTVEMSGQIRKALPMRLLLRFPANALAATAAVPGVTPQGNPLLEWQGLKGHHLYRITITEDADGTQVLRRYLTADPRVDLRALKGRLDPAKTYYWRVDAVAPDGRTILTGPTHSFIPSVPHSRDGISPVSAGLVLASFHPRDSSRNFILAEEIKTLGSRTPAPDSTVTDPKAPITIQFSSAPNPFDLALTIDGTDVTSLAQVDDTKLSYLPALALADGTHTVALSLGQDSSTWKFTVKAGAAPSAVVPAQGGSDVEVPAASPAKESGKQPGAAGGENPNPHLQMQTQIASNTQWVSGSAPDTNALSLGQQMVYREGDWTVQMNGSGLLNSTLGPKQARSSVGLFNNYVTEATMQRGLWGADLRFGIVAPSLYLNSQFVTPATPRQGLETVLNTPGGKFGFYVNTDDLAPGGGSGFAFHQQLMGASWDLPLPKKYAELRLMWLSARDTGTPAPFFSTSLGGPLSFPDAVATPGGGDLYGGLLVIHLPRNWAWSSEYAWGYNTLDLAAGGQHLFGRAWRSGIAGPIKSATLSISYSDVGANFISPANPGLTPLSNPDRRGVTASLTLPTKAGTFNLGDQFLENGASSTTVPEQQMQAVTESWSKNLDPKTALSLSSHQTITNTGNVPEAAKTLPPEELTALEADQRDLGANLTVTRQVGKVSLSVTGARDWFHDNLTPAAGAITSSILAGVNWNYSTFFQLNSNIGLNWVAADKATVGGTRGLSWYLQPAFTWRRPGLQVAPLATSDQTRTELLGGFLANNLITAQYGGRVSWTMPGDFKFSTLSFEGDFNQNKNVVTGANLSDNSLFLVWTVTWGRQLVR